MEREKLKNYFDKISSKCEHIKYLIKEYDNFENKSELVFNYDESDLIRFLTDINLFAEKLLDTFKEYFYNNL